MSNDLVPYADMERMAALDRFERKFVRGPIETCWLWMAGTDPAGYGVFYLTADAVKEIHASPLSDSVLARHFGVTKGTINHVRHRRNWRHIEA